MQNQESCHVQEGFQQERLLSSMSTDLSAVHQIRQAGEEPEETSTFPLNSLARRARDSMAPQARPRLYRLRKGCCIGINAPLDLYRGLH